MAANSVESVQLIGGADSHVVIVILYPTLYEAVKITNLPQCLNKWWIQHSYMSMKSYSTEKNTDAFIGLFKKKQTKTKTKRNKQFRPNGLAK